MELKPFLCFLALLLLGAQAPLPERVLNRPAKPGPRGANLYRDPLTPTPDVHLVPRQTCLVYSVVDSTWFRVKLEGQAFYARRTELTLVPSRPTSAPQPRR